MSDTRAEQPQTEPPLPSALPSCPGCGGAWSEAPAVCSRCGLERADAERLVRSGRADQADAYRAARQAALAGAFGDARRLLAPYRADAPPEAVVLDRLCAAVLGEANPAGGKGEPLPTARSEYASAYAAARRGDYAEAARLAASCVQRADCLLPAQRLLLLALAGAGQPEAAERRRRDLARLLPGDPDLARWQFADSAADSAEAPPLLPPAKAAGAAAGVRRRTRRRSVLALVGALLPPVVSAAALLVATTALLRVSHAPVPPLAAPTPPAPFPAPAPSPAAQEGLSARRVPLAPALAREASERREAADLAQAREWFNRAVRAKAGGDWAACDRLAAAAYSLAPTSYLADESLLLRAQAAENRGDTAAAAARYAAISDLTPRSAYAAWALGRAARLARRAGQPELAARCRALLRRRYPSSSAARAAATEERPASMGNSTDDDGGVSHRVDG